MKYVIMIFFCAMCTGASAQWYHISIKLKKKEIPRPLAETLTACSTGVWPALKTDHPALRRVIFGRTEYSLEVAEAAVMKIAQHNMRFRVYNDASYNFTELAHLFVQQNRYSEAVWYLLQSNNISRQQNDDKHTIENLVDLATIKATMGEIALAEQDLTEAHELAWAKGLTNYLETIGLAAQYITQNKPAKQKPLIYADGAQNTAKAE